MIKKEIMTVQQVSEYLHLKPSTIRNFYRTKKLNGIKQGKLIYFSKDDVIKTFCPFDIE